MKILRLTATSYYPLLLALISVAALVAPALVFAQETNSDLTIMQRILWWIVANVFGWFPYATGKLLDWTITELVLNFGLLYQTSGLGVAINNVWSIVRDLFNLTFIFGLIYIGFRLILFKDSGGAKKAIGMLVVAALLVNFSLFFSKFIIDFSNIAAVQVSRVIYQGNVTDISLAFANSMGLGQVWNNNGAVPGATQPPANLTYIFGSLIVFMIAGFCFAVGAVLLFVRFITLNFLMALSPLMFIGFVVSNLKSWQDQYIKKLLNQAFFAPVFLLMIYFSLYILSEFRGSAMMQSVNQGGGLGAALGGGQPSGGLPAASSGGDITAIAGFLMAAGFLIASVLIAQKMSITGADTAVKLGQGIKNRVRSGAVSGAMWLPRKIGRGAIGGLGAKYDARLKARGVPSDSTLRGWAQAAAGAKFGGTMSYESRKKAADEAVRNKARAEEVKKISASVNNHVAATKNTRLGQTEKDTAKINMERAVAGASTEQLLKAIGDTKSGTEEYNAIVGAMSASQFDAVIKAKEEDLNDADKAKIAEARNKIINNTLVAKGAGIESNSAKQDALINGLSESEAARIERQTALNTGLRKATIDDLKVLGSGTLSDPKYAGGLSFSQIDEIKKSGFTQTEKDRILEAHKSALQAEYNGILRDEDRKKFFSRFKEAEVALLPKEILLKDEAVKYMTGNTLSAIVEKETLNSEDRKKIKDKINTLPTTILPADVKDKLEKWFDSPRGKSSDF